MLRLAHSSNLTPATPPRGFTLLELITAVLVAAIVVAVGVPSFSSLVRNSRATTYTNDLIAAFSLARSEAIHRGAPITVCGSTNGTSCNADANWTGGWIVLGPDNDVIRAWPARTGGSDIVSGSTNAVQFLPRGTASAAASFGIELPNCTDDERRAVGINAAGRVFVDRVSCQ